MGRYYIFDNDENRWMQGSWVTSANAGEQLDLWTAEGGPNASYGLYVFVDGEKPPQ